MIRIKFISIRNRILLIIFAALSVFIGGGTIVNSVIIKNQLVSNIEKNINTSFNLYLNKINDTTNDMKKNGADVAVAGELFYRMKQKGINFDIKTEVERYLIYKVNKLPEMLGSGLWYEPLALSGDYRFFGSYAYWENNSVKSTWEYNTPEYNYIKQHWYTCAVPEDWNRRVKRENSMYLSSPYLDRLSGHEVIFLTMSTIMYGNNNQIIGVSSTDWSLDVIHKFLEDFHFTENSFVTLIDIENNKILYHPDNTLLMKGIEALPFTSNIDKKKLIREKTFTVDNIKIKDKYYKIYYCLSDIGFLFVMGVPPGEAYHTAIITLAIFYILSIILIVSVIVLLAYVINRSLVKRILLINSTISEIEDGNYNVSLDFHESDEITNIGKNITSMAFKLEQRETQILKLQRYLSSIIESMPSIIISLNEKGEITQWNRVAEKDFNIKYSNAITKILWDIVPMLERFKNDYIEVICSGQSITYHHETIKLDSKHYYNISIFPLQLHEGKGGVFRFDDITELEIKDQQLRQAQKLETVGTLAGGLAHDFNNVLGSIIATVSLLQYYIKEQNNIPQDKLINSIDIIEQSSKRAADIVQQLLVLSRKKEIEFKQVDLNVSLENMYKMCQSTFEKSVEIKINYNTRPAYCFGDASQLEQAFLNIAINGYHAMTIMKKPNEPQGGILQIYIEKIYADKFFCKTEPEAKLNTHYWCVSIRDTGVGMDSKIISKIFDPFFTTKDKNKGTGLGLAMVYNIIQQHKGFINVYSEPHMGSTFNLYLPVLEESNLNNVITVEPETPHGEGTVLIVDDEPLLRKTAGELLTISGYDVLYAENGNEAIDVYRENKDKISVIIIDLIMPQKSGKDTVIEIFKMNPCVNIILSSGFKQDERIDDLMSLGIKSFIQKPFTMSTLAKAVHMAIYDN